MYMYMCIYYYAECMYVESVVCGVFILCCEYIMYSVDSVYSLYSICLACIVSV